MVAAISGGDVGDEDILGLLHDKLAAAAVERRHGLSERPLEHAGIFCDVKHGVVTDAVGNVAGGAGRSPTLGVGRAGGPVGGHAVRVGQAFRDDG